MFHTLKTGLFILPNEGKKVECVTSLYNKLNFFFIHIFSWTQIWNMSYQHRLGFLINNQTTLKNIGLIMQVSQSQLIPLQRTRECTQSFQVFHNKSDWEVSFIPYDGSLGPLHMTECKQHWTTWQQILSSEYQQNHNKNVHGKGDPSLLPNSIFFFGFFWVSISQLSTTFQQI
jgi:hypothetical protein